MDFGLEQPPRTSYSDLPSYIAYMSHVSTNSKVESLDGGEEDHEIPQGQPTLEIATWRAIHPVEGVL
jgi:hypothetical protein